VILHWGAIALAPSRLLKNGGFFSRLLVLTGPKFINNETLFEGFQQKPVNRFSKTSYAKNFAAIREYSLISGHYSRPTFCPGFLARPQLKFCAIIGPFAPAGFGCAEARPIRSLTCKN
jgi:hypothetical protein